MAGASMRYDDETHTYWIGALRIPSVTQILTLTGHIDTRWFNENSAERGRRVHAWAERCDLGTLDEREIPEDVGGEVEAYRAFLAECRPVYSDVEKPLWHRALKYGGRRDRGCRRLFGTRATLEIKTGCEYEWHGLQLAGYERLAPVGARWAVYLGRNGRYKIRQHTRADDHQEFLRALRDVWDQMRSSMTVAQAFGGATR